MPIDALTPRILRRHVGVESTELTVLRNIERMSILMDGVIEAVREIDRKVSPCPVVTAPVT